jgi:hypothetical protein
MVVEKKEDARSERAGNRTLPEVQEGLIPALPEVLMCHGVAPADKQV